MLVRVVHFLLGALLAAGGGYLAWTNRAAAVNIFPQGVDGMPWLAIAGVLGLAVGVTFLVSAVHPRPNRRARLIAEAEIREAKLGAAESYYSERSRAADRDWRSGDIPAPVAPAPEPVRVAAPPPPPPPPPPVAATPAPQPVAAAPAPAAAKPVATSAPPMAAAPAASPFPAAATLAPIPAASEPPPPLSRPPAPPVADTKPAAAPAATAPAPAAATGSFDAIRSAIAVGQLDEAEKMLNAARAKADGVALAELTGLAGDHAAAAGRLSNAKWLWRLAAKRFGELGAMDTPAAKAVAESLRTAG